MKKTRAVHRSINRQLLKVVRSGSAQDVKRCLSRKDCDPLARDDEGCSALMWAVWKGHEECVRLLLPVSDPLAKNDNGASALMLAAFYGHKDCVRLLLPVSDPLVKANNGLSASQMTIGNGHSGVAGMIDAYVLALNEEALLSTDTLPAPPRRAPVIRI